MKILMAPNFDVAIYIVGKLFTRKNICRDRLVVTCR